MLGGNNLIINTHDYEALRIQYRIANPDKDPLPTIEEVVDEIMVNTAGEVKLEVLVEQVSRITRILDPELTKVVFNILHKLEGQGKVARGSKHGYWLSRTRY